MWLGGVSADNFLLLLIVVVLVIIAVWLTTHSDATIETMRAVLGGDSGAALHTDLDLTNTLAAHESLKQRLEPPEVKVGGARKLKLNKRHGETPKEHARRVELVSAILQHYRHTLYDLNFDWSSVLDKVTPVLKKNREYVGTIDYEGGKLRVTHMEPGESAISGKHNSEDTTQIAASISRDQVLRVFARDPSLFLFHTHPIGYGLSPLPSPLDIYASAVWCFDYRCAGSLVIGEYGVIMTAVDPVLMEEISSKPVKEQRRLVARFLLDLSSTLMTVRSWRSWKLADLRAVLAKLGMIYIVYPNSKFVADDYLNTYVADSKRSSEMSNLVVGLVKGICSKY